MENSRSHSFLSAVGERLAAFLRAVAARLDARPERSDPPVPARSSGPPADWVNRVKDVAPHLLQPGRPSFRAQAPGPVQRRAREPEPTPLAAASRPARPRSGALKSLWHTLSRRVWRTSSVTPDVKPKEAIPTHPATRLPRWPETPAVVRGMEPRPEADPARILKTAAPASARFRGEDPTRTAGQAIRQVAPPRIRRGSGLAPLESSREVGERVHREETKPRPVRDPQWSSRPMVITNPSQNVTAERQQAQRRPSVIEVRNDELPIAAAEVQVREVKGTIRPVLGTAIYPALPGSKLSPLPARATEPPLRQKPTLPSYTGLPPLPPSHPAPSASTGEVPDRWPALPTTDAVDPREGWDTWAREQQHRTRVDLEHRGLPWTA